MKYNLYVIKCEQSCSVMLNSKNFINNLKCWCFSEFSKFCTGKKNNGMIINMSQEIKNKDVDLQLQNICRTKVNTSKGDLVVFRFGVRDFMETEVDMTINHRKTDN